MFYSSGSAIGPVWEIGRARGADARAVRAAKPEHSSERAKNFIKIDGRLAIASLDRPGGRRSPGFERMTVRLTDRRSETAMT